MKKFKFNIIDFLIILLVAAVIGAGIYILGNKTGVQTSTETTEVILVIEEKNIDAAKMEFYRDNVKKGAELTIGVKEKVGGTLEEEIQINAAKMLYENLETGEKSWVESQNKYDVTFTIRADVTETDKDFLIGTDKVKVGYSQNFVGDGYLGDGTVLKIEKVGGDK